MMKLKYAAIICLLAGIFCELEAQRTSTYVDKNGVIRWENKEEVYGFGVNYTTPFAHAYRSAIKLGVDPKEAINHDIYHFSRLGFDAYRVHVWDTEISDSVGNLLENEHLKLFDYMFARMKERGMNFILTPIAFWGNGYPEPEEDTPGFAHKYGKAACLTNEDAIKAQERYLFQFLEHVNPETGLAYKDDPSIVAFEVSNEPHHDQSAGKVTNYINRMVDAMRRTGCKKPIFYNISHSVHLADAYFDADIQGGTFQWYPTNLLSQEELGGNFLPNVDEYNIPFAENPGFKKIAKIVYEFDAADIGKAYMYPAMARSFRTAGMQWAAHFAYDPMFMAYANTEYSTHYMNLAYTPQKALGLKIAGEVFHEMPRYKDYGNYPGNARFGPFTVSYQEDLAEMVTDTKFIYTNSTRTTPPAIATLTEIAGTGNSPIVRYEGTGVYFLDQIKKGVWRLEVMPDAIRVSDPFGSNSLEKQVTVINWRDWPMYIDLPDLGNDFAVKAINNGNSYITRASDHEFSITPGTYILSAPGTELPDEQMPWKNIRLNEFVAPATNIDKTYVLHSPGREINVGESYEISAEIVTREMPEKVLLSINAGDRQYLMEKTSAYTYTAKVPAEAIKAGILKYYISVMSADGNAMTFPCGTEGAPGSWDFHNMDPFVVNVVAPSNDLYIFNAMSDFDLVSRDWSDGVALVPLSSPGQAELHVAPASLGVENASETDGKVYDYTMRYYFGDKIKGRKHIVGQKEEIVVRGRSLTEHNCPLQVALITADGQAFGATMNLGPESGEYVIPLESLKKVKLVTLPRPYPTFIKYYFEDERQGTLNPEEAETLQISLGPGIPADQLESNHGVAIESVRLR